MLGAITNIKTIKIITLSLVLFSLLSCGDVNQKQVSEQSSSNSNELQKLVIDYGNAMNNMAGSSLYFGGDSETQWAIDTVNAIWNNCLSQPFDFLQYMSDIAIMEKYFAYGIDYFPMTLYWSKHYHDKMPFYKTMFDGAMHATDSIRQTIKEGGNWRDYFRLHACSLNMVELYLAFCDDLTMPEPVEPQFLSMFYDDIIDGIYFFDSIDPAHHAWRLDGTSFYVTYVSFLNRFPKDADSIQFDYKSIEYALKMDKLAQPTLFAWYDDEPFPEITESDNESFLKTALPIYTDILNMVSEKLKKSIPNE